MRESLHIRAIALGVATLVLGCLAGGCSLQTSLIFPGADTQGAANAILNAEQHEQIIHLQTSDGTKITAIFGKALCRDGEMREDAATRPTIIYFYGNGSCAAHSRKEIAEFRMAGANVIVADYEGYGMSQGRPSETGCYATSDAEYEYLLSRGDVDPQKIVAAGWSLGAAVAIDLASKKPVAGLMTFSAFTSMDDMGQVLVPWLPQSMFLSQHFYSLKKMRGIHCPVLIVHGMKDPFIPPAMADRLADAAKGPVTRLRIPEGGHNDLFEVGGETLAQAIGNFLEDLPTRKGW